MKETPFIWKNGHLVNWQDASVHVLSHAIHYATSVFEGIRAYSTPKGPAIFKAVEHYDRLMNSAGLYDMDTPYSTDELIDATKDLIKKNGLKSCYIRPIFFYGYKNMGLVPRGNPIETVVAAWEWGSYLGEEGLKSGIRCTISSWNRINNDILPTASKCAANYANSILAKQEALDNGFEEAILLNTDGTVSEGPGENIFRVKDGKITTPPISDNPLEGITRATIMSLADDHGYSISEESMSKNDLLEADELFFTGTAAEVTPIREIDGHTIGSGQRGPITEALQTHYFQIVEGRDSQYDHWLTYID